MRSGPLNDKVNGLHLHCIIATKASTQIIREVQRPEPTAKVLFEYSVCLKRSFTLYTFVKYARSARPRINRFARCHKRSGKNYVTWYEKSK